MSSRHNRRRKLMHIARFSEKDPSSRQLVLAHVKMDIGYYIDENEEVVDEFRMLNIGANGFIIVDSTGNTIESSDYGKHDICWSWMIKKAIEIEELNHGHQEGS